MKRDLKSRSLIKRRMREMAESLEGTENLGFKQKLYELVYKLEPQSVRHDVRDIDRAINEVLDILPGYIKLKQPSIVKYYLTKLDGLIKVRGEQRISIRKTMGRKEKGEVSMFTGKKKKAEKYAAKAAENDNKTLEALKVQRLGFFDDYDKHSAIYRGLVEKAAKLAEGTAEYEQMLTDISVEGTKLNSALSLAKTAGQVYRQQAEATVASDHAIRIEEILKNQPVDIKIQDIAARIKAAQNTIVEKGIATDEALVGIKESYSTDGGVSENAQAELAVRAQKALNEARELTPVNPTPASPAAITAEEVKPADEPVGV